MKSLAVLLALYDYKGCLPYAPVALVSLLLAYPYILLHFPSSLNLNLLAPEPHDQPQDPCVL